MKSKRVHTVLASVGIAMLVVFLGARQVFSHCDTMGGPVITDAKVALANGDVKAVLKWVQKADEDQVRKVFDPPPADRPQIRRRRTKELADTYFFETLVRIHRAGEGEPYTGLKPADVVDPAIAAADKAIETNSVDDLAKEVANMVSAGIRQRFSQVAQAKKHVSESVDAGRQYVRAYVEFVHYVEAMHATASGLASHHAQSEQPAVTEHKH